MRTVARAVIVVTVLLGAASVAWMFKAPAISDVVADKADVVGGVAGVLALALTVALLWPRVTGRRLAAGPVVVGQAAVDFLATETLRYWRTQAKDRRITTPSPAAVRWGWASAQVAVPAAELEFGAEVLTAGVVTRLREQLYDRLGGDRTRIVLLGGPGAGKTAAMLLLLIDILEQQQDGSRNPVPVWLTLGSWNPDTTSLREWAAATMTRDYPGLAAPEHGGPGAAAGLLRTGRVALFLDGLDEMPPAVQGTALQRIDRDAAGLRIVLTSRTEQYRAAVTEGRLYGAAVIDLLPVGIDQAAEFLLAEQLADHRDRWQQVIDDLRNHPNSVAARTLTTPLALSLARDTYTTAHPADLLDIRAHPTPDILLKHLLARFLTLAYPDPAQYAHATRWLTWIAQRMRANRDLHWWDIPRWQHNTQTGLTKGLGGMLGGMLAFMLGLGLGLVLVLLVWLGVELAVRLKDRLGDRFGDIDEPRRLTVRWPARRDVPEMLIVGLGVGLTVGHAVGLVGLAGGFVGLVGLVGGLVELWSSPLAMAQAASSLDVYRVDRRRTLAFGLLGGLLGGLVGGLAGLTVERLTIGLVAGVVVGLALGAGPAMRLALVELIWALRFRPVRFLPLLQAALDRQVLRQAGAVYQFRHAALQDLLKTLHLTAPTGLVEARDTG